MLCDTFLVLLVALQVRLNMRSSLIYSDVQIIVATSCRLHLSIHVESAFSHHLLLHVFALFLGSELTLMRRVTSDFGNFKLRVKRYGRPHFVWTLHPVEIVILHHTNSSMHALPQHSCIASRRLQKIIVCILNYLILIIQLIWIGVHIK